MGALFNILAHSIGSLFIGLLITFVGVSLMFFIIKSWRRGALFSPLSFVVGAVLFCLLAFQSVLFCGAVTIKSYSDDVERAINGMVEGIPDGVAFSQADSQQLLDSISREWPLVGYYVNLADFSGHTPATIASAMADELRAFMNRFMLRRLGWCLLFVVVGAAVVLKTMRHTCLPPGRGKDMAYEPERRIYDD